MIHTVWACCLKLTDGSQFVTTKISPVVLCLIVLKEAGLSRESSQTDQCCRQTEEPIHSEHGFTAGTMVPAAGKPVVSIFYRWYGFSHHLTYLLVPGSAHNADTVKVFPGP